MGSSKQSEGGTRASEATGSKIECADARRLTAAFVNGGLERKAVRLLHGHLDHCEECRTGYREALEAAGRLGAGLRESKRTPEGRETATERNQRIVQLASSVGRRSRRPFALRALLLTIAMVIGAGWIAKLMDFPNPAEVRWVQGEVGVGDATLGSETDAVQLIAASWCWTGELSRASVELDDTLIELAGGTQLQLENRRKRSFRLRSGSLSIDGPCDVLIARGVVRVHEGRATISFTRGQLAVENGGGRVEYLSSLGSHFVEAGEAPYLVN